jgi:hypothetical protein
MGWLSIFSGLLKGPLSRVLDSVDKKTQAGTDREKLKADIIRTHYETRAGFMQAGGFVLMLLFAVPLAAYYGFVAFYSMFLCSTCWFPQSWIIAALPPPLDEWSALIVISIFGVQGLTRFARR